MFTTKELDEFLKARYEERKHRTDEYCEGFIMSIKLIVSSYPEEFPLSYKTIYG
jgi:hypothetical protein